ncbi:MAG: hypothetical protein HUJ27_03060 [Rhodobacteraceae bacterium]|nr:hypothetical protein [Paracoccaceae bacterium]
MYFVRTVCILSCIALVSACARSNQPEPIQGQIVYNKFGEASGCEEGVYIPGAPLPEQCLPPDEECDPRAVTFDPNCPPPRQDDDPDPQREPVGAVSLVRG